MLLSQGSTLGCHLYLKKANFLFNKIILALRETIFICFCYPFGVRKWETFTDFCYYYSTRGESPEPLP